MCECGVESECELIITGHAVPRGAGRAVRADRGESGLNRSPVNGGITECNVKVESVVVCQSKIKRDCVASLRRKGWDIGVNETRVCAPVT